MSESEKPEVSKMSRRDAICTLFGVAAALTTAGCQRNAGSMGSFFRKNFREMGKEELSATLERLERRYGRQFGRRVSVRATPPQKGVVFGYALDVSRCIGCRRCVYACVDENNQSRNPQVHWIRVLEMEKAKGLDLLESDAYYDSELVPEDGKFYFPVQCQQCENPPCVKVCPVGATWKDPDGIVVIDYDWCVGCRNCLAACPYEARHFNWAQPVLPVDELNPETEFLGNRPRPVGVVEKCTFCLQRSRLGGYPACVEVCPVGARKFGNLLDPESEIRYILDHHQIYILKEDLNTQPKFFHYFSM